MQTYDSVFSPIILNAPPIDKGVILSAMEKIENRATKEMAIATKKAVAKIAGNSQSLQEIADLQWDLESEIAQIINGLWESSTLIGSKHAIAEIKQSIPQKLAMSRPNQYAENSIAGWIKKIFEFKPTSFSDRPVGAVKKILSRNLLIAGNYANELLDRVKDNLTQGMTPQGAKNLPLSPKAVNDLIKETLSVSSARASMISRTETTTAYNDSRVETFSQSQLVTHLRFIAISDDRTTDICRSRNNMVFPIADAPKHQPALHVNCRSVLSPLMPKLNAKARAMVDDVANNPANRTLTPLAVGWR